MARKKPLLKGAPRYNNLSEKEQALKFQKLHELLHACFNSYNACQRSHTLAKVSAEMPMELLNFYQKMQELELRLRATQAELRNNPKY